MSGAGGNVVVEAVVDVLEVVEDGVDERVVVVVGEDNIVVGKGASVGSVTKVATPSEKRRFCPYSSAAKCNYVILTRSSAFL